VVLSILRFANVIGPSMDSPLTRYLRLPVVPTVLGYDPRLQLCHESDAVEVLRRACVEEHAGIYNVAGPGIIYLSQAIRLVGRPSLPVPLPLVNGVTELVRRSGRIDLPVDQLRFLLYGRVGDITRLRSLFGYEPRFSTKAALVDFVASRHIGGPIDRQTALRWERELYELLTRTPHDPAVAEPHQTGARP
jgi:UDP-glucose 4-epimerase